MECWIPGHEPFEWSKYYIEDEDALDNDSKIFWIIVDHSNRDSIELAADKWMLLHSLSSKLCVEKHLFRGCQFFTVSTGCVVDLY